MTVLSKPNAMASLASHEMIGVAKRKGKKEEQGQDPTWHNLQLDDILEEMAENGLDSDIRSLDILKVKREKKDKARKPAKQKKPEKDVQVIGSVLLRFHFMRQADTNVTPATFVQGESDSELESDEDTKSVIKTSSGIVVGAPDQGESESKMDDGGKGAQENEVEQEEKKAEEAKKKAEEAEKEAKKQEVLDSIEVKNGPWQVQVHVIEVRDLKPVRM